MQLAVHGRSLRLGAATICWLGPGQRHQVLSRSADIEGWRVTVGPPIVSMMGRAGGDDGPFCGPAPSTAVLSRLTAWDQRWLYERLAELVDAPAGAPETPLGVAFVLLRAWRAGLLSHNPDPAASAAVLQVMRLLADPATSTQWTATRLARAVGMTPGNLARRFRLETGRTLTDFRLQGRLNRYLDVSDDEHGLSITEAAYEAGFGSYAQFYRVFVRSMGTSPSEHRHGETDAC